MKKDNHIFTTYFDLMKIDDEVAEVLLEVNKEWLAGVCDTLGSLACGGDMKIDALTKVLKPNSPQSERLKRAGDKASDVLQAFITSKIVEAYTHGYSEGRYDAETCCAKSLDKLASEGELNTPGDVVKFASDMLAMSQAVYHGVHKGETLQVSLDDLLNLDDKK